MAHFTTHQNVKMRRPKSFCYQSLRPFTELLPLLRTAETLHGPISHTIRGGFGLVTRGQMRMTPVVGFTKTPAPPASRPHEPPVRRHDAKTDPFHPLQESRREPGK